MNNKINETLIGKTIESADINGFGIELRFTDGSVFDYSASDGGYSSWDYENTEQLHCCICGEPINGFGNDPWPYNMEGRCCDICNYTVVIPVRIKQSKTKNK